MPSFQRSVAVL